jgi:hypothetical protein
VVVWSPDIETHKEDLAAVFSCLHEAGFQLKLSKCAFFQDSIDYLGFRISHGRIAMDPEKVAAIRDFAPPTTKRGLQRFLGMCGWYRRFIKGYSTIASPLFDLLSVDPKTYNIGEKGSAANIAFEELKKRLTSYPIMRLPDFNKPFVVIPDASAVGTGAVLAQEHEGFEHPVHYISKSLAKTQRHRHSYINETIALVRALEAFHHYLAFLPFVVATDCRALAYWNSVKKDIPNDVARYLSLIASYNIIFVHRPAEKLVTSDAMSRDERWEDFEKHLAKEFDPKEMVGEGNRHKFRLGNEKDLMVRTLPVQVGEKETNATSIGLPTNLSSAQAGDDFSRQMINLLTGGKVAENWRKKVTAEKDNYLVSGKILFREVTWDEQKFPVPYVPAGPLRREIITALHADPVSGHVGIDKTVERVSRRYYWHTIRKDVEKVLAACHCHLNKSSGQRKFSPLQPLSIGAAFEDVHLDFCGPFPETKDKEYKYILVIVDRFTKWVELIPTRDNTMTTAAHKFDKRILKRWSTPKSVLVDNAFNAGEFKVLCSENGIFIDTALPYQKNTNGLAERMNRTVEEMLRAYVSGDLRDWNLHLAGLQAAINNSKATSHKYCPADLATSVKHVTPIERKLAAAENTAVVASDTSTASTEKTEVTEVPKIPKVSKTATFKDELEEFIPSDPEKQSEWRITMRETKRARDKKARENIAKSQEEMVKRSKRKLGPTEGHHKVGSWVALDSHLKRSKLEPVRWGPYKVAAQDPTKPSNYTLRYLGIPGTDIVAHTKDISVWPNFDEKRLAELKTRFRIRPKGDRSTGYSRQIRHLVSKYNLKSESDIKLDHIIGKRVEVLWSQFGWEPGTIVAEEKSGKFWVKYDKLLDENNEPYFLESLLTNRPPQWRIT